MEKYEESLHPLWGINDEEYYIRENTTKLIIGTMPPAHICANNIDKSKELYFFYGSKDNHFWQIMNFLNSKNAKDNDLDKFERFKNVKECKDFLDNNNIGLLDIIKKCEHKIGASGKPLASDKDLKVIDKTDLIKILKEYKNIDTIFYTGEEVVKLLKKDYEAKICPKINAIVFEDIDNIYRFYQLYSPSRMSFYNKKIDRANYLQNYHKLGEKNKD